MNDMIASIQVQPLPTVFLVVHVFEILLPFLLLVDSLAASSQIP